MRCAVGLGGLVFEVEGDGGEVSSVGKKGGIDLFGNHVG